MTGTVIYHSPESAESAIRNLNRTKLLESVITIERDKPRQLPQKQREDKRPEGGRPNKFPKKKRFVK